MVCTGVIRLVAICACCAVAVNSLKKNEATAEQLANMPVRIARHSCKFKHVTRLNDPCALRRNMRN
jgi:hypothetical protein|eukprot:SAG25_NODE_1217_length_3587_cov_3.291858_5_plen_66_part_00